MLEPRGIPDQFGEEGLPRAQRGLEGGDLIYHREPRSLAHGDAGRRSLLELGQLDGEVSGGSRRSTCRGNNRLEPSSVSL